MDDVDDEGVQNKNENYLKILRSKLNNYTHLKMYSQILDEY